MTETFDAVLAEGREEVNFRLMVRGENNTDRKLMAMLDRLAAAHAAEVAEVRGWNERVSVCRDHTDEIVDGDCVVCRAEAANARADAATALLRECLQFVPDDLAARVAEMAGQ